jgi:hypothetical protein
MPDVTHGPFAKSYRPSGRSTNNTRKGKDRGKHILNAYAKTTNPTGLAIVAQSNGLNQYGKDLRNRDASFGEPLEGAGCK